MAQLTVCSHRALLFEWLQHPNFVNSLLLSFLHCRYFMGIIPTRKNLELCDKVNASAFCRYTLI